MELKIILAEQLLRTLMTGKRVPGSIFAERVGNEVVIGFNQYRRNVFRRRHSQTLLSLPHGWIRKSAKRYKLHLSLPDNLGERRVGELMRSETEEARSFMNALESVLDNAV